MALVVWSDAALRDLDGIFEFIAGQNPLAAVRISKELLLAGESLASFPRRGRRRAARRERELVSIRPYILV